MSLEAGNGRNGKWGRGLSAYVCLVVWLFFGKEALLVADAAEGAVFFGSESYAWNAGDV